MVYIVIVNWNGWRDTLECLESLLCLEGDGFRIFVCDNDSADGSAEKILDWAAGRLAAETSGPPWALLPAAPRRSASAAVIDRGAPLPSDTLITVIRTGGNLGFAGANNVGTAYALADPDATHVWYLNNDTVVHPMALKELMRHSGEDARIGICGATLYYYEDPGLVQGVGAQYNIATGRGGLMCWKVTQAALPATEVVEATLSYVVGASMLVTRRFLETIGLMSEDYFLYFEELDWSLRNAGRFRQGWAREAIVYHKEGASIGTKPGGRATPTAIYYQAVNLLRLVKRHRPFLMPLPLVRMLLLILRSRIQRDSEGARIITMALMDFLSGRRRRGKIA